MNDAERQEIMKAAEAYQKHQSYMKSYNTRPEIKAKRKAYNSRRWQLIKRAVEIMKAEQI
jgi:hypothetical protein